MKPDGKWTETYSWNENAIPPTQKVKSKRSQGENHQHFTFLLPSGFPYCEFSTNVMGMALLGPMFMKLWIAKCFWGGLSKYILKSIICTKQLFWKPLNIFNSQFLLSKKVAFWGNSIVKKILICLNTKRHPLPSLVLGFKMYCRFLFVFLIYVFFHLPPPPFF